MEEALRHLSAIERPSASEGERVAAEWIAASLRELGAEARIEVERAHGTFWWPLGLLNVVSLIGAALGRTAGRVLAAAAFATLVDDLDHRSRWFRRAFLPRRRTWNVIAETGDPEAARTVVVVAHHDAAHGGAIFDTRAIAAFARRFPKLHERANRWPPLMWAVVLGPLLVALGRRRAGAGLSVGVLAALADVARSPVAPGANDNLSAVAAVLALARALRDEPVRGLRVLLVSTGSEESLSEGMQAFGERHFPALPRESTTVVALECLGSGRLAVPESEGFLLPHFYDGALKDLATECARRAGIDVVRGLHVVFASDAQIAVHAGYPTMLLGGIDDLKLPAHYHKPTDLPENIQMDCLADAVHVLDALVRELAADQDRASSERATASAS
jgi:hypothetical protein